MDSNKIDGVFKNSSNAFQTEFSNPPFKPSLFEGYQSQNFNVSESSAKSFVKPKKFRFGFFDQAEVFSSGAAKYKPTFCSHSSEVYNCITAMEDYVHTSLEEIRYEDYLKNYKKSIAFKPNIGIFPQPSWSNVNGNTNLATGNFNYSCPAFNTEKFYQSYHTFPAQPTKTGDTKLKQPFFKTSLNVPFGPTTTNQIQHKHNYWNVEPISMFSPKSTKKCTFPKTDFLRGNQNVFKLDEKNPWGQAQHAEVSTQTENTKSTNDETKFESKQTSNSKESTNSAAQTTSTEFANFSLNTTGGTFMIFNNNVYNKYN